MKKIISKLNPWFKAAFVRAIRTVAQTAVGVIGSSIFVQEVNWVALFSAAILAGITSMLTSIGGLPEIERKGE